MITRCNHTNEDGRRCYRPAGHEPPHRLVGRLTPEENEEICRYAALFHPCTCASEGTCEWCRSHCNDCGVRIPRETVCCGACAADLAALVVTSEER